MRRALFAVGATVLAGALTVLNLAGVGSTSKAEAADPPPLAVEDFNYPNADQIFAAQGILLKRGDGHITLVDCASETGLIEILARGYPKFCFKTTGSSGFLTLELPRVYGVKGNDYSVQVDMTVDGTETSYDVPRNAWKAVGESADPEGRDHTLVEIRSTL